MKNINFNATFDDPSEVVFSQMWQRIFQMTHPEVRSITMESDTSVESLDFGKTVEVLSRYHGHSTKVEEGLLRIGGNILLGYTHTPSDDEVKIVISHEIGIEDDYVVDTILLGLTPAERSESTVRMKFWYMGTFPTNHVRGLEVPRWVDIQNNYSAETAEKLDSLMKVRPEDVQGGRLILMHGPPGTGKTTAIRALTRSWNDWCTPDYITDPERFFGEAAYMIKVLLEKHENNYYDPDDSLPYLDADGNVKWRLMIVEDAEEFIQGDGKDRVGQGMSRLLNITDGLVGQGLKILILITTNVQANHLASAITRPGRCLSNISVPALSQSEATKWFGSHHDSATLAQLFEDRQKSQINTELAKVNTGQYL